MVEHIVHSYEPCPDSAFHMKSFEITQTQHYLAILEKGHQWGIISDRQETKLFSWSNTWNGIWCTPRILYSPRKGLGSDKCFVVMWALHVTHAHYWTTSVLAVGRSLVFWSLLMASTVVHIVPVMEFVLLNSALMSSCLFFSHVQIMLTYDN